MSIESQDRQVIADEVKEALIGCTDNGLFLAMAQVRETESGTLVADLYSDKGEVVATYELEIVIGKRLEEG